MRFRSGGLASWSIRHPVGVVMITLAIVVLGGTGKLTAEGLVSVLAAIVGYALGTRAAGK